MDQGVEIELVHSGLECKLRNMTGMEECSARTEAAYIREKQSTPRCYESLPVGLPARPLVLTR